MRQKATRNLAVTGFAFIFALGLTTGMPLKAVASMVHEALPHGMPDFCPEDSVIKNKGTASGNWSDPKIWSLGRVPGKDDLVEISGGATVTYDAFSDAAIAVLCIEDGGALRFRTDINTRLTVGTIQVMPGGTWISGEASDPIRPQVTAEIIFEGELHVGMVDPVTQIYTPSLSPIHVDDPDQFGIGFLAPGGKVRMHGAAQPDPYVKLAIEPKAGDTVLYLEKSAGWKPGDWIFIPDTNARNAGTDNDPGYGAIREEHEIKSVSLSGREIVLQTPLKYDHPGARNADGTPTVTSGGEKFLPHAGHLTRNLIFRSKNPKTTRGHVLFTHRADVDVRYTLFQDLGRTRGTQFASSTDRTLRDADGKIIHVGTNPLGRYALHAHLLMGPINPANTGYQYVFFGNVIVDALRWALVIHSSHYGLVSFNVIYGAEMAGIATEAGNETENVISHNLVARVYGMGRGTSDPGNSSAAGYWLVSPRDFFFDNIAAQTVIGADLYLKDPPVAPIQRVPKFRGADPMEIGKTIEVPVAKQPMTIDGFLCYGTSLGFVEAYGRTGVDFTLNKLHAWHTWASSFYPYGTDFNIYFNDAICRGQPSQKSMIGAGSAIFTQAAGTTSRLYVNRPDIQGFETGFKLPPAGFTILKDGYLNNLQQDVYLFTFGNPRILLENCIFDGPKTFPGSKSIFMYYKPGFEEKWSYIDHHYVYVKSYNRLPGDDFQVYFQEQHPSFVLPSIIVRRGTLAAPDITVGDPNGDGNGSDSGMTNQECWDRYNIALAGLILPASAQDHPDIRGKIGRVPYSADPWAWPYGQGGLPTRLVIWRPWETENVSGSLPLDVRVGYEVTGDPSALINGGKVQFQLDGGPVLTVSPSAPRDHVATGAPSARYSGGTALLKVSEGTHTVTGWVIRKEGTRVAGSEHSRTFTVGSTTPSPPTLPPLPSGTTLPTISLTAPLKGATVSGTVAVSASASDNVAVAGVQFKLDGNNLQSEDTTAPYSISWNTAAVSNGVHTLTVVARGAAGNAATSASVSVTVANGDATTPPVISNVRAWVQEERKAQIRWETDKRADSQVEYGTTSSYGSLSGLPAERGTRHAVQLSGLTPKTLYHYRARSRDAAGNLSVSQDYTFTTP